MYYLFTHPAPYLPVVKPTKKGSACAEAWKHWHKAYEHTKPVYSALKLQLLFQVDKKMKRNNNEHKLAHFADIISFSIFADRN